MKIKTDIIIAEKLWKKDPDISKKIKSLIKIIIPQTSLSQLKTAIEISILLTNDEQIQELNKNYRHKNKPTNVLSFPLLDGKKIKNGNFSKLDLGTNYLALGDIVISYQTVLRESEEQNKTFIDHLTHLIIHSLLHLIGFDHNQEKMAKIMEDLEVKILKNLGIKNPY
ncbi:MAG: rRNA maturation RNase YbeY [Pseudomonadota bacterium]